MTVSGIGAADTYALAATLASTTPSRVADAALAAAATDNSVSSPAAEPQPAVQVTLGSIPSADDIYAKLALASTTKTAWARPPIDDISKQMQANLNEHLKAGDLPSLFSGLGSQLLSGFSTSQGDFHQAVVVYRPLLSTENNANPAEINTANTDALQSAKSVQNNIALKIRTVSGKTIDIAIAFGGSGDSLKDSLSIDLHSSDALSTAEQVAIAKLADGFEAALQGIGQDSTKIDVSGLIDFDTGALASLDLNIREAPRTSALQSLDLHIDAGRRTFALQSQAGKVAVNVDLSAAAPLGSAEQQQTAVKNYLAQFDAAGRRGHGDQTLTTQFKDAFSQLHSSYPTARQTSSRDLFASRLSSADKSTLSGLADFQASISGDFNNSAVYGFITEAGHLDYQVSQSTETHGADKTSGLSVEQTLTASLDSTFNKSRGGALDIDAGNYDVYHINDHSSTTTSFEYADDKLKNASITRLVTESQKYQKLIDHKIVAETDTPHSSFNVEDISEKLRRS